MGALVGLLGTFLVLTAGIWSIGLYEITDSTFAITVAMMQANAIIIFFQVIQSVTSKGILRGGGDTKFLMVADVIFQWCASIPLGFFAGIVLGFPPFWVLIAMRIDYYIKAIWLSFRLRGDKWTHKAKSV